MKKFILTALTAFQLQFAISQNLSVDFTKKDTVVSMVGFLHAMNEANPHNNVILPLKPAYWRGGYLTSLIYKRANTMGAKYIQIVSDLWGRPGLAGWTPPYIDTNRFKNLIDKICLDNRKADMIYDVWNEPDNPFFFSGGTRDFYNVFKIGHDRFRQNLGSSAEICGPSTTTSDKGYLLNFCNFCLANNIQLDVFSFHWIDAENPENLKNIVLWCRQNILNNPVYAPLKIKKIVVNEIINAADQYNPSIILSHYYYLEKGKADGACRACWLEKDASSDNCWNNTLNGLLTPNDNGTRSTWWATKAYAELDSLRYISESSNSRIYSMAGNLTTDTNVVRVIIGNNNNHSVPLPSRLTVTLNNLNKFSKFPANEKLIIIIYKVPNTDMLALPKPKVVGQYVLSNEKSSISLPAIMLEENAVVYADIISMANIPGAINRAANDNKLLLFPNPATSAVYIFGINNARNYETILYSSAGQLLFRSNNKNVIDISGFANGTYFIKVKQGSTIYHQTFIKK